MVCEIQEASARLNRLVGNLLDVTRLESGHVQAKLDWCDVGDLIQSTLRIVGTRIGRARSDKLRSPEKLPLARLDFALMQQALSNLLLNAAVHTPAGHRRSNIEPRQEEGVLELSVADHGPALPPELLPRIFDKFFRAPNAPAGGKRPRVWRSSKGFVEAQGGQISAAQQSRRRRESSASACRRRRNRPLHASRA